jgi:hypothetical protein
MTIQATGDAAGGRALLERYAKITPEMAEVLAKLNDVPVDIKPSFEHF